MAFGINLLCEPLRSLDFTLIGPVYTGIGTVLDHPASIVFIQNYTDVPLMFSFNSVDDHFPLQDGSFLLLDATSNRATDNGLFLGANQRLYVRTYGGAPSSGEVYFTSFYGKEL